MAVTLVSQARTRPRPARASRGFSLLEILIASAILVLVAMMGTMHVVRTQQHVNWARDKAFAREKAVSIVDELRSFVEGDEAEAAADLDSFDDGLSVSPVLTITPDPLFPGEFVQPDHPASGNVRHEGVWRWYRRITVRPYDGVPMRDLRLVTVRVYRVLPGQQVPGDKLAEVSTSIRTIGDAYPTTQVYDVYLLAMENVPGWWVHMDAIQPFIEATLLDLQSRNRGLVFRTHWITKLGFGRDEEYAPYTNEARASTDSTPWAYVYPGRLPIGEAALRYYVPGRMKGRLNLDGELAPTFVNDTAPTEPYTDMNGNGRFDRSEPYTDWNGNNQWDVGNPIPYAVADQQNHCMRYPDSVAKHQARVQAGVDDPEEPTWRMLLDRMVAEPDRFHNAILMNLHGELLPMPPARNYSDAAKDPENHPGWRVVTHPELLRPRRVAGDDALSDAPRFRVYAYKTAFPDDAPVMTQEEPFVDADGNGAFTAGETFTDWNGNGVWDAGTPITLVIRDGDFTRFPNDTSDPTIRVRCLPGGVDGDGDGNPEPYADWQDAPRLPETFTDASGDGVRQVAEVFFDLDGNGTKDDWDPWQEVDGDGVYGTTTEALDDANGNGILDLARPAEPYTDLDGDGQWDAAEPFWDEDGDGQWTPPTTPATPYVPWSPAKWGSPGQIAAYIADYGEPFLDLNGNEAYDRAEVFTDTNGNGVRDGGFERGEMWFEIAYLGSPTRTVVKLHGTPLETPYDATSQRGLPATARLYDLEYVPCPTPSTSTGTDRFARDLYTASSSLPKNTARWTIELPLPAVRKAFETVFNALDGDTYDRIVTLETRIGRDLTTGTMWPTRHEPQNRTVAYAYFYGDRDDVPFSERYQFIGDPRHSPYADTDRQGLTVPNGYNWYFEDLGTASGSWLAFDPARLDDGWLGRGSGHDVPRLLSWLRTAITKTEAVYTTLTGFSYYYLSLGGDVGYDAANGFANSIPMDGTPFGIAGAVNENTITGDGGSLAIRGSLKFVRANDGGTVELRAGGPWWSKPWLGELFPDSAYASQWAPWGNLRANTGTNANEFHLIRRADVPLAQQPTGTTLVNLYARLKEEGSTSLFNVGTSFSTFHHQYADGGTGQLVEDGPQLAQNYNFPMPAQAGISRPFGLATSSSGGVGPEFSFTDSYPRYSASMVTRFYSHTNGQTGSGLVRLTEPGVNPRSGYVVVNGIDRTLETGSAFIARYSVLSLLHGFLASGEPGMPNRIRQLPRVEILSPTLITELQDPASIEIRWSAEWKRWDGEPYTAAFATDFAEDTADVVYVLLYSSDGGRTWRNMRDGSAAEPGVMPWIEGSGPDPARTQPDLLAGAEEVWTWTTPPDDFPEGSYLIRIEAYRASETLHYAHHQEKIYVER